jgi:small basic protein
MRVGMIQLGVTDLLSPKSIQPDRRVTTMGASSECFSAWRAKLRTIFCVEVVVAFVMALILSQLNQFRFG